MTASTSTPSVGCPTTRPSTTSRRWSGTVLPSGVVTKPPSLVIGRAKDCDLIVEHPTVSTRHARLTWSPDRTLVVVEDLASANGTFVRGERVTQVAVRPGDEVTFGQAPLPWSSSGMRRFLRYAARGTVLAAPLGRSYSPWSIAVTVLLVCAAVAAVALVSTDRGRRLTERLRDRGAAVTASTDEEAFVRGTMVPQLRRALDPTEPVVRNTAVQLAARTEGPFHVEQVAAIWTHVRTHWRYVNDPNGREYVAMPKESIENQYAGDCDDFAVTLAAMVRAIGGDARVVFMEGPRGGHAYAEACVHEPATDVATKLAHYYGRNWARYAGSRQHIAYRSSDACPVWLNLDWNANVPGGDYEPERWAVAAYADGRTEVLAVAPGTTPTARAQRAATATAPRRLPTR